MTVVRLNQYQGTWGVPDANSNQGSVIHALQVKVTSSVAPGSWLVALVGWHTVPGFSSTVTVGDDASNRWVPIASSDYTPLDSPSFLNVNPSFSSGATAPWVVSGGTLAVSHAQRLGVQPQAGQVTPNGVANTVSITSNAVPVTAYRGQQLTGSAYAWFTSSPTAYQTKLLWLNGVGAQISSNTSASLVPAPSTWLQSQVTATVPATAVTAKLVVQATGTPVPTSDVWYATQAEIFPTVILNPNPGFESGVGPQFWGPAGCTISGQSTIVHTGFTAARVVPTAGSKQASLTNLLIPATANLQYTLSAWMYAPAGLNNAQAFATWTHGQTSIVTINTTDATSLLPGVWTQVRAVMTAPPTADHVTIGVKVTNSPQPYDVFFVDDVTLQLGGGYSAGTRVAIWAAPNALPDVTTITIAPTAQVTAMAGVIYELSGMPNFLQVDSTTTFYNDASASVTASISPTQSALLLGLAGSDLSAGGLVRRRDNWSTGNDAPTVTNGTDSLGDQAITTSFQVASSSATFFAFNSQPSINPNPAFSSNVTNWTAVNGTVVLSSAVGFVSGKSALLTPNGTSVTVSLNTTTAVAPAVVAGHTYVATALVSANNAVNTHSANVSVTLVWLNSSRVQISSVTSATAVLTPSSNANPVSRQLGVNGVAPTAAAFGAIHVNVTGTPPATRTINVSQGTLVNGTGVSSDLAVALATIQLTPTSPPVQPSSTWPNVRLAVAFGQAAATPPDQLSYTDISDRLFAFTADRGRNYELDALEAGQVNLTLRNDDGFLTPENDQSPFDLQVYNHYQLTAQWNGRIYGLAAGYVERWPQSWVDPHYGITPAIGTDAYAMYTKALPTVVQGEHLLDKPFGYWPCNDAAGASAAVNLGLDPAQTPLVQTQSSTLGGSSAKASFGSQAITLVGDQGTCWQCQDVSSTTSHGFSLVYDGSPLPPSDAGVTVSFWCRITGTSFPLHGAIFTAVGKAAPIIQVWIDSATTIHVTTWNAITGVTTDSPGTASGFGNVDFALMLRWNSSSWTLFLDNFTGGNQLSGTDVLASDWSHFEINGRNDRFTRQTMFYNVSVSHVAVYPRQLSFSRQVTYLFAGSNGMANDAGNNRIERLISYAPWTPPTRLHYETSFDTSMAGATDIQGQDLASAIDNVVRTNQGLTYVDRNGYFAYRNRQSATARPVQATLGENTAAGEIPYRITLTLDYDPQFIQNDLQVTHLGTPGWDQGVGVLSGSASTSILVTGPGSISQYGDRSQQVTSYFDNLAQSVNLANYLTAQYAQPKLRVQQVEVDLAGNPDLFDTVLALEVGDRVILNRRPIGANLISIEVMIIGIHHDVSYKDGRWLVQLDIVPAATAAIQVRTLVLDDPDHDKLDADNVAGWK